MDHLDTFRTMLGSAHVLTGADTQSYDVDWRGRYRGRSLAVVQPATTDQVAAVMHYCAQAGIAVVPQGGNTGLCGACTPDASGANVVLSLTRLNKIRNIDTDNDTIEV